MAADSADDEPRRKSEALAMPVDDGVSFAYGGLVATMLGPEHFAADTDPEHKWRDNCLKVLLAKFELGGAFDTMTAISHGETEIEWTKLAPMIHAAEVPPRAILQTFVQLMAQSSGYDCRSRTLMFKLAARLQISYAEATTIECALADYAMVAEDEVSDEVKAESDKRRRSDKYIRRFKIGLGTVAGGVLIGVTGGLAAPLVAAGATAALGATAGAAVASGGVIAMGVLFGSTGAGLMAYKTNKRYGELKQFEFRPLSSSEETKSLGVIVNVAGWIPNDPADEAHPLGDFFDPFITQDASQERYTLVWESAKLHSLARALINFFREQVVANSASYALKTTVFAALMAALVVPATLVAASEVVDNPWGVCLSAAEAAGKELANVLLERVQGKRPVTLVGSSLGCLVVVTALKEMARRSKSEGIVQDVYLFGAPCSGKSVTWNEIMPLVAGKVTCCLSPNDSFIKLMMRGLSVEQCVAGLEGINHPRAVNIDVSELIVSHTDWVTQMPKLQHIVGLNCTYNQYPSHGHLGARVHVRGLGDGIIRYCGWVDEKEPILHIPEAKSDGRCEWLGIALDDPIGDNDGSLNHGRHFDCGEGHGVYIPLHSDRVRIKVSLPYAAMPAVQDYSSMAQAGRDRPHGAYSPVARSHLAASVKLVPTPNDTLITLDLATVGKGAWGKGRAIRNQQGNAKLTVVELAVLKVRISNIEEFKLSEAAYTIAVTSSKGDWIVSKTYSDCKGLHEHVVKGLGKDSGFPDSFFTSAKKRQPLLESWLQGVLQSVTYMPPVTLGQVFAFFETSETTSEQADTTAVDVDSAKTRTDKGYGGSGGGGGGGSGMGDNGEGDTEAEAETASGSTSTSLAPASSSNADSGSIPAWPAPGSTEEATAEAAFQAMLSPSANKIADGIYADQPAPTEDAADAIVTAMLSSPDNLEAAPASPHPEDTVGQFVSGAMFEAVKTAAWQSEDPAHSPEKGGPSWC